MNMHLPICVFLISFYIKMVCYEIFIEPLISSQILQWQAAKKHLNQRIQEPGYTEILKSIQTSVSARVSIFEVRRRPTSPSSIFPSSSCIFMFFSFENGV
ncbi:hypothetical protein J1N35_023059 [Gossypium stocksii]|uniref:Uncharacterized protein n=1 Tax=Gossypium stocksii TaxID=47602 RepID=A0A9D3VI45_9ROSI|nr:hypothetical protein J1N35_023059 [Gossypium stocksii]